MILPTMNDEEKVLEVARMSDWLCGICNDLHEQVVEKFKKGTRFPYFQRYHATDDKNNLWTILFYIKNKEMKKKKVFGTWAYITYDVPRKRKENDLNAGKGVLLFNPFSMSDMLHKKPIKRPSAVFEVVPHAFNRYTQRYLKPRGLDGIEFAKKFENMIVRWQWFDISADLFGDKNAKKHSNDGLCPYDVVMSDGGLLRGFLVNNMLVRFNTYINKESMYGNQIERHGEMVSEYYQMKRAGDIE